MRTLIWTWLPLVLSSNGQERLDLAPTLEPLRIEGALPALGAAIVTVDGGVVALGVSGIRSVASEDPVTEQDPWHLGSCTKAMTSTLVARLVEAELVAWTTTLGDVFGEEREVHEGWRDVTLLELLAHRSGASANPRGGGMWILLRREEGTPREMRRKVLALLREPPPHPRGEFLYSNTGYTFAGALLEEVLDRDYEDLMREHVFAPLGMNQAGFGAPGSAETVDAPRGHWRRRKGLIPVVPGPGADNPQAIAPAGTVHAPLEDWARFVRAHLAGAAGDESFLSGASWTRLHEPIGEYGPGWFVTERPWAGEGGQGKALNHSGSNTMWYCVAWLAPERGFAVLITTNVAGDQAQRGTDRAAAQAIEAYGKIAR